MKHLSYFLLLCFFLQILLGNGGVFAALSGEQKGIILRNFKVQEKEMVFESNADMLGDEASDIFSAFQKLNIYQNIGENLQEKREYLEAQNERIGNRIDSLEASIKEFDESIANLIEEIEKINDEIIVTKTEIETTQAQITLLKKQIEDNTQILLKYLVYIYKKGDTVYGEEDIDNLKSILLSGENIDELLNDLYFKSIIQLTGQQLIDKHRSFVSSLYIEEIKLKKSQDELTALRKAGMLEKKTLDEKKAAKERLLEITQGQEALYQKYIADNLAVEREVKEKALKEKIRLNDSKKTLLDEYGCEFVDMGVPNAAQNYLSEECLNINKIIYAESRLSGVSVGKNPLSWPLLPLRGVSAFFHDQGYIDELGEDHDAIDIPAAQGTDIHAPMDGYVTFILPPVKNGYAYIALKHSDGLVTLYGHVSEVNVELYDFVNKGEVFAKSGGAYGTPGAGVLTTGPHLHFVVYENEEYKDPLNYLDVSYLKYADLPDRYMYKYLEDFKTRKGFEYKNIDECAAGVFCIRGDSEIERQKYLLSTYGVGDFRNWDIWVEESVSGGIDPTFTMCVGLAETTLGKYLKTPYNIGNVGNTDSGATITFPNARAGIAAMIRTFNNQYLSQYDTIDQLSRYGNKDLSKPIYASSDYNWHNNITKCMSHVKGEYIPDEYPFRQ